MPKRSESCSRTCLLRLLVRRFTAASAVIKRKFSRFQKTKPRRATSCLSRRADACDPFRCEAVSTKTIRRKIDGMNITIELARGSREQAIKVLKELIDEIDVERIAA